MKEHRLIVSLACAMMVCFFVLSTMQPKYLFPHFYQAMIYLVIILMLFYFQDRWAYMLGILVPAVWLLLAYGAGLLGGTLQQASFLMRGHRPTSGVTTVVVFIIILAVAMMITCYVRWKLHYADMGKGFTTFGMTMFFVGIYYAILIVWFSRIYPG